MTEKKRRRVEPKPGFERGDNFIVQKFGILRHILWAARPVDDLRWITEAVELPFETSLLDILDGCFEVLAHYGIERPDPKRVAETMRHKGLEPPPESADHAAFLRADPAAYLTAMLAGRVLDGAMLNCWAHPVQLATKIVVRIGHVWRLCEKGPENLDRQWLADFAAGIGVAYGQLEMALRHERDALVGKRVRTGNREQHGERNRKRRELWAAKLAAIAWHGPKPKHGEIERIAQEIARELGSAPAAERRWYERNVRQRRAG